MFFVGFFVGAVVASAAIVVLAACAVGGQSDRADESQAAFTGGSVE